MENKERLTLHTGNNETRYIGKIEVAALNINEKTYLFKEIEENQRLRELVEEQNKKLKKELGRTDITREDVTFLSIQQSTIQSLLEQSKENKS